MFPASLRESRLGLVPEEWESGFLSDVTAINPEAWSKGGRPDVLYYVDLSNTKWGRIEAVVVHSSADAPSRAKRILRCGDTIVGTVRPGNGSFAFVSDDGFTGSTGFAVLRPAKAEYREFVYLAATAPTNIDALALLADGGAYPAVRPKPWRPRLSFFLRVVLWPPLPKRRAALQEDWAQQPRDRPTCDAAGCAASADCCGPTR